jgi:hypothetical protein
VAHPGIGVGSLSPPPPAPYVHPIPPKVTQSTQGSAEGRIVSGQKLAASS